MAPPRFIAEYFFLKATSHPASSLTYRAVKTFNLFITTARFA